MLIRNGTPKRREALEIPLHMLGAVRNQRAEEARPEHTDPDGAVDDRGPRAGRRVRRVEGVGAAGYAGDDGAEDAVLGGLASEGKGDVGGERGGLRRGGE
jgi:hypothetical protein